MSTDQRRAIGAEGERLAALHFRASGYSIVERNFRTRFGELDLVVRDPASLVFCEVKTRLAGSRGGPARPLDGIGPRKRARVRRMAAEWLGSAIRESAACPSDELRFDAIGVTLSPAGRLVALEHVEGAF